MKRIGIVALFSILYCIAFGQETQHKHSIYHALIENKGQWDSPVLFQSKSKKHTVWVQQHGFIYDIRDYTKLKESHINLNSGTDSLTYNSTIVAAHYVGSNTILTSEKELPTHNSYNYFLGKNSSKWASDVHGFQKITLPNFYDGIDLKVFDNEEQFKTELWCSPGSNPNSIQIDYKGLKSIRIDEKGNLILTSSLGDIIEQKPTAYQLLNGKMSEISCSYRLENNRVSFQLGKYNPNATLVIDPVLVFATYCGSVTDNFGMTATYGYDGTAYSGGTIYGNAYPTPDGSAYDVTSNFTVANVSGSVTTDVFLSKYSADGTTMIWTTFLGGGDDNQGTETVHSLICDQLNNVYLYGVTSSLDFPIVNGFQTTHGGGTPLTIVSNGTNFGSTGTDIFVAKVSSNGQNLIGSTYFGGSQNDGVNFKVTSGSYNNPSLYDSLTTNYGDQFRGEIMIDSLGDCIIASCSRSANFPILNAFQPTIAGQQDGVLFKLSSNLSTLQWSSFFGGSENDACYSVKIDSSYNIIFAGGTSSLNLPATTGSLNPTYLGGKTDGFVGKLTPNGQTLVRTSYIGTTFYDQAFFVEIDRNDNVFLYGQSIGGTFPIINGTGNANSAQFIMKLDSNLTTIQNSTIFGNGNGAINISPSAFLVDICGNMYISGWGANILLTAPLSGMPTTSNGFQTTSPNGFDFYIAVFDRDFDGLLYGSYIGGSSAQEHVDGGTSRFDKNGVVYQSVCGGCNANSDFPTTPGAWSSINPSPNCNNLVFKFDFELIPEAEFTTMDLTGCADFEVNFVNTSPSSDSYLWDFGNGDTTSTIYSPTIIYSTPGTYLVTLTVTDSICLLTDTATIVINVAPQLQLSVPNDTILCVPSALSFTANSFGTSNQFIWSSSDTFADTLNVLVSDSVLNINPSEPTTYYIQTSNGVCSKIDSVRVSFIEGSLQIFGGDSICEGSNTQLTVVDNLPTIDFNYVWSPDSVITLTPQNNVVDANPTSNVWIVVSALSSNGCTTKDSIFITVGSIGSTVSANANPTVVLPQGQSSLTSAPSGFQYTWTPSTGLSNPNTQNPTATLSETTTYTVSISDGVCSKNASVTIQVLDILCGDRYVYVPNAFSPNGDKENDVLFVRSVIAEEIIFRVFDRWGEMVFETTDLNNGWDGSFRGKPLSPDTYDYYLEATCFGEEKAIIKGNITLLK